MAGSPIIEGHTGGLFLALIFVRTQVNHGRFFSIKKLSFLHLLIDVVLHQCPQS